jgi:hypothetical protein
MATKTIHVTASVVDNNGVFLMENQVLAADTFRREATMIPDAKFRFVDLRLAIPYSQAEYFLNALRTGKVDITVDGCRSELAREAA